MRFTLPELSTPPPRRVVSRRPPSSHGSSKHSDARMLKYGLGVCLGIAAANWIKRNLSGVPVLGVIADLMPATLVGAAAGASVVYCIQEGDSQAVQKKLLPKLWRHAHRARSELELAAKDVKKGVRELQQLHRETALQLQRQSDDVARAVQKAAREAERTLGPALERHAQTSAGDVERALQHFEQQGRQALEAQQQRQQQQGQQQQGGWWGR